MEAMPLDKIRLRFPDDLEQAFRDDFFRKSLNQLRFSVILGAALYSLFGILDAWIFPEMRRQTWLIRYAIVLPICVALVLFSFSSRFKKYMQIAVVAVVVVAGAGIVAMMVIVRSPVNYFHFAGLLLIIMYSYNFSKMRFLYTCLASWAVVALYEIAAVGIIRAPLPVFLNDNFFYVAANLIGMFSSYHRELYMRKDFFQNRIVQDLEEQKHRVEKVQLREAIDKAVIACRESEEKFRTLAETAAIGIFIHQGGNFLYANRASEIIGGYTVKEYLNMDFLGITHPDYVDMIKARARERLTGGGPPPQYEFKIIRKDGTERWVLMTAGVMTYEGKPAVIGTLIDITARKQAEEERERFYQQLQQTARSLQESEKRFRTLAETTAAGIFIYREKKLLYANSAIKKITGYSSEELLSLDFWSVVHPEYRDMARERGIARLQGEYMPNEYEIKIRIKNGEERWGNVTAGVIDYEGSPAIIVTFFDITDRKLAEEEKERLYEERIAEEKRHLLEKEKLLMDLHDGIGGITTNISILSEVGQKAADIDSVKRTLGTISRLSREGIAEVRSFMQSLDIRELTWRTLAAELRSKGTNMVEPHQIGFSLDASVDAAPDQLGSLFWVNVLKIYKEALTNIIKHADARTVSVVLQVTKDRMLLSIQDDGAGLIEPAGTGRGLANMRKRAEDIGGNLTLSSGNGTLIMLEVPLPLKYPVSGMAG